MNECKTGAYECHENAACVDRAIGYDCVCKKHYHGDGFEKVCYKIYFSWEIRNQLIPNFSAIWSIIVKILLSVAFSLPVKILNLVMSVTVSKATIIKEASVSQLIPVRPITEAVTIMPPVILKLLVMRLTTSASANQVYKIL